MATPTISSSGYAGTISDNDDVARWIGWLGGHWYTIPDPDFLRVTAKDGGTRQVDIAGGYAGAVGVMNKVGDGTSANAGDFTIADDDPSVATWYMLCLHYEFSTTQATSFKVITAGVKDDVPARDTLKFGGDSPQLTKEDQPLALVQLTPGQAAPTQVIDLRLIGSNAVYLANDKRVLSYAGWPGVLIRIGTSTWVRTANEWVEIPGPHGRTGLDWARTGVGRNGWSSHTADGGDGTEFLADGNMVTLSLRLRNVSGHVQFNNIGNLTPDKLICDQFDKRVVPDRGIFFSGTVIMPGGAQAACGLSLSASGALKLQYGPPGGQVLNSDSDYALWATVTYGIGKAS